MKSFVVAFILLQPIFGRAADVEVDSQTDTEELEELENGLDSEEDDYVMKFSAVTRMERDKAYRILAPKDPITLLDNHMSNPWDVRPTLSKLLVKANKDPEKYAKKISAIKIILRIFPK